MTVLYNCKHDGDQYRITKFNSDFNVEASYLCDLHSCECPAGHRPHCRHRGMLPKFIQRQHVGDNWFYDHDRGGWVQGWKEEATPVQTELTIAHEITLPNDVSPDDVANAFGDLLAPKGLGQPSEPIPSTSEILSLPQYNNVPYREVESIEPSPLPSPTIRRRV